MADHQVHDLTPDEVSKGIAEGRYLLVDVREPNETALERYPGAVLVPLSAFDPAVIPAPQGCEVVFACRNSGIPIIEGYWLLPFMTASAAALRMSSGPGSSGKP